MRKYGRWRALSIDELLAHEVADALGTADYVNLSLSDRCQRKAWRRL